MIRKAELQDVDVLAELACQLWSHHTPEEMAVDIAENMGRGDAAFFIACDDMRPIGFAQCQIRHDYVEGTASSPVGYLEGIYTLEWYRNRGIAKQLLCACEAWAKEKGCVEFASDCELDNAQSLQFHLSVGFQEANRIICFTKQL